VRDSEGHAPPPASEIELGGSSELHAVAQITDAVQAGAGLPEILRTAARALDTSLVLIDRSAQILAVAARSPADERSLMRDREDVTRVELKVADATVGELRMRSRPGVLDGTLLRLVTTLIASEVERVRAPERATEQAATAFLRDVLLRRGDPQDVMARGKELGLDLSGGAAVLVVRARPRTPTEDDWRRRLLAVVGRAARSIAPGAVAVPSDADGSSVVVLVAGGEGEVSRRVAAGVLRELESGFVGFQFAVGRSRWTEDPGELARAGDEAMLAANVVEGEADRRELAFEETGTYQLLLPYMSDPAELKRFYRETIRPLVAYDEQYETDLLGTLATFLDCDANVNATAARLFTHRHTVRYRFERIRELTGLDVQSSDGREKLSLGLKAMRALGIAPAAGPASEPGAKGGRVRR
jgi:DNA-binding PucR family transcriptional regulator